MKLFFYYAFHSVVNQIRKLLKTWVLIFLLCCGLLGGIIGYSAARIETLAEEEQQSEEALEEEEEKPPLPERLGMESGELFELIGGVAMLALFSYQLLNTEKNGARIFQSADVNLLFASPMQPQSVLLFRMMTQLGTAVFMVFYLLLQLPNLTLNMGLTLPAALGLIVFFCAAVLTGKLLQLLLYTLSSTRPRLKASLRPILIGFLALLLGVYALFHVRSALPFWQSASRFLNGRGSSLIPLWGWLKGFLRAMADSRFGAAALYLLVLLAGQGALIFVIWHIPADFYEDAMAKSEETARLRARAQAEETSVAMGKPKKDRSEKLLRDGLRRGKGASVFFFKNMYNRRRFARLGFLTKTSVTYLLTVPGVTLLCRRVFDTEPFLPVMLTLAVFSYFRSMGNPLETDTTMDFFLLVPDNLWKKLFYSLLSAAADCLLDLLPAAALAVALCGGSVPEVLGWLLLIVSVNLYATAVGAFINLSVPVAAGKTVKSIVQISFVYFGLLPDAVIMAVGVVTENVLLAALGALAVNLLLGSVFFVLTPLFLDPKITPPRPQLAYTGSLGTARRQFSRLGWGLTVILGGGSALQLAVAALAERFAPAWLDRPCAVWILTFAPLYLAAFPLGIALMVGVPSVPPEKGRVHLRDAVAAFFVSIFFMYTGNLLGTLITALLDSVTGAGAGNPLMVYVAEESLGAKLLIFVILAPVLEETVFRKLLVDRLRPHGEKLAVLLSGLLFGAFHGNLSQFFYAAALGTVFAYVYLKTGRLWCSVGLHMGINFLGGIVAPAVLEHSELASFSPESFTSLRELFRSPAMLFFLYVFLLLISAAAGLLILCVRARSISFREDELTLPRGKRLSVSLGNGGTGVFLLCSLALIVYSFILSR